MSNNLNALTRSHRAIAGKKRARREEVKEVLFDDNARHDFLTGFHKRKLQKKEDRKQKRELLEKQEKDEYRRERRRELAERAKTNAAEVEAAYGHVDVSPDPAGGESEPDADEAAFEDEEQLATVTVVEDFDPDTLIHGPPRPKYDEEEGEGEEGERKGAETLKPARPKLKSKPKARPKKIAYETKAGRKAEKGKQHARKLEKAERAGGKPSNKARRGGKR